MVEGGVLDEVAVSDDAEMDEWEVEAPAEPIRWGRFLLLVLLLPMFGETFHYIKDLRPLWALSKAFPVISLPLVFWLYRGERPVGTRQMLITLLYLFLVPSFLGIWVFQQNFFLGLTSQVKLLPLLYFFSFLSLLRLLKLTPYEIKVAFLSLAVFTMGMLVLSWQLVPHSFYTVHYQIGDSPLFSVDSRGYRIRWPMYFGLIGTFYCYRRFWASLKVKWLLWTVAGFWLVLFVVKTRAYVLGTAGLLLINAVRLSKPSIRLVILLLIPFAVIGLFSVPYVATVFSTDRSTGFDVRAGTIVIILNFLGHDLWRWLFGVGSISPLDPGGMIHYFNHWFFLADLTWLGIVFEFGLVGAVLFALVPLRGLWESRELRNSEEDAFLGCLQDYIIYALLASPMSPIILAPGEFTLILALFVYEKELTRQKQAWWRV